ncbi:hypothetical protein NDU88_006488 [Pleurodeles waltl]|uniref:Uncharacterized protein n=1 Tax=Pleurodeles waltl TaxID=8319 RepID=A0AAV7LPB2_PLEWA|nr:hypothetical protein NDU88_006488 [Pleurodeles waltl]
MTRRLELRVFSVTALNRSSPAIYATSTILAIQRVPNLLAASSGLKHAWLLGLGWLGPSKEQAAMVRAQVVAEVEDRASPPSPARMEPVDPTEELLLTHREVADEL